MKPLITLFICLFAFTCQAQTIDSANRLAALYFKEAEAAAQNQHIWNAKLFGPTLFVDAGSRTVYANMPDSAGILKPVEGIYQGVLPKEVMVANTAIFWGGRLWSVILWPLPAAREARLNLVLHESFHRIQVRMGLPMRSPMISHLGSMNGRIYFLLELQALKAAMGKPVNRRTTDLTNALIFREKRCELFPATFKSERILEMNEGLAEYTGVILGRTPDSIRQHLYQQIDSAGQRKSLIRSAAYITGPVYGYLLHQKFPGWTLKIDSNSDFPVLIAKYYHINMPALPPDDQITMLEKIYNGDAIITSEKVKEEKRMQVFNQYIDAFTRKPVLTLQLMKPSVGFNPNTLFDLGEYGTVYPSGEVADAWGHLEVSANGMLIKDWKVVTVPVRDDVNTSTGVIDGNGWKLTLNEHWQMVKVDALHFKLVENN